MLGFLWRAAGKNRLRPWRSPYLRWRIETYWGLHADRISPATSSSLAASRAAQTTRVPAPVSASAHARPMPRLAPVTNAVLFGMKSNHNVAFRCSPQRPEGQFDMMKVE